MAQLESIVLENFQSIRDRTTIPVRPLTLLYGPNSSGKSAIYDAFELIKATFGPEASADEVDRLVLRWAHETAKSETRKDIKIEINLSGICFEADVISAISNFPKDLFTSENSILSGARSARLIIEYHSDNRSYDNLSVEIYIDEIKILGYYEATLFIKLDCFAGALDETFIGSLDSEGMRSEPAFLNLSINEFDIKSYGHGDDMSEGGEARSRVFQNLGTHLLQSITQSIKFPELVAADRGVIDSGNMSVLAYRTISSNIDRFGRFNLSGSWCLRGLPQWYSNSKSLSSMRRSQDQRNYIEDIAQSSLDRLFWERFEELFQELRDGVLSSQLNTEEIRDSFGEADNHILMDRRKGGESLFDFVNRSLGFHLFTDRGYQLAFDACEVRPPNTVGEKLLRSKYFGGDCSGLNISEGIEICISALLVCSLVDNTYRRLTFEDVGTGLSCLIPVLVGLYSSCSFIQQPELHLHPALQSAMGDVCIEAARRGDGSTHFIETHSEHLLLRILKRIRQASAGRIASTDTLAVKAGDLSILYFDPQPDGSTKVKRIRVTDDGEFLDRWPRGFFEERGRELFDE
jgi:AAA ATPase domain/Protein of unknown function (DUF3696)